MDSSKPDPVVDRPDVQSLETMSGGRLVGDDCGARCCDGIGWLGGALSASLVDAARSRSCAAREAGSPILSQAALIEAILAAASGVPARSGWYFRARRRYAAWMTSSSASGSTWRTLYGSIPSGIVRTHAHIRQRDRERLRLVRGGASKQGTDNGGERGGDRQGEDRPEQPRKRPADDDREDDRSGVELDRIALDLRDEEIVLDLLDEEVEQQRGKDRHRPDGRRQQHRRHRRHDRPDDRHELEQAGDDGQQHRVAPEDRVDDVAQHDEPDERGDPDREAEKDLATDPLSEVAFDGLDHRPGVEPPRVRE